MLSQFLSPAQIATLNAVHARLIPADEWAGAHENGVAEYLARQFAGDLKDAIETYRAGLEAIDAEALARYEKRFCELPENTQDHLLETTEREAPFFFQMLVNHCAEGYYADPGNGGNHDRASWQMIGFLDR
jgi:hypothetical protein